MSTHLVDLVLAVMLIEAIGLRAIWRRDLATIACVLLPGAFLVLALREAMRGDVMPGVPLFLLLAFVAHLADLRQRLRR